MLAQRRIMPALGGAEALPGGLLRFHRFHPALSRRELTVTGRSIGKQPVPVAGKLRQLAVSQQGKVDLLQPCRWPLGEPHRQVAVPRSHDATVPTYAHMGTARNTTGTEGNARHGAVIDRNRIEPPYLQLAEILEARIKSGELGPGTRVPSITDLMGTYDVGKNTAIRALAVLRDAGLVEVRQGWGTFVSRGPVQAE